MAIIAAVFFPLLCAAGVLAFGKKYPVANKIFAFLGALGVIVALADLFSVSFSMFYAGWVVPLSFFAGIFENTVLAALVFFALIVLIYSLKTKIENEKWFYFSLLFTLSFANGAVLADNLVLMLFFWEGLLLSLYVFIVSNAGAQQTAFKAFIINAVGDIALLSGVVLTAFAAGSAEISIIKTGPVALEGYGAWAFLLMCAGALAKAGAVPFHSWIPDAAEKTNVSFMALLPSAFEKILAVFLLGRIMTLFSFADGNLGGQILVCLSVPSVIVAVFMLFKQKDLKGFISYNIILQIGLLAFEQGAAMGGPDELINHGIYKAAALAGLFLCAGIIEFSAGASAFDKIGGAFKKIKITAAFFIIFSAVLCGVTPLNLFFTPSYAGLESGNIYGVIFIALVYVFMTAAFLKAITVLFKGNAQGKPAPALLNFSAGVLAVLVLLFAAGWVFDAEKIFNLARADFAFTWVSAVGIGVIVAAAVLRVWSAALSKFNFLRFTPPDFYGAARAVSLAVSTALYKTDRFFDFIIDVMPSTVFRRFSKKASAMHTGLSISYILWALLGALVFAVLSLSGGWV